MSADALQQALEAGKAQGVLPADAQLPSQEQRPWPVVLLTALGAWLATVPLLGVVGLLLGDLLSRSVGPYLVAVLLLAGAVTVLRSRDLPVFVEQLALPALLVGGGALGFGLFRDMPDRLAAGLLAGVAAGLAIAIARPWLRVLLGAGAACLSVMLLLPSLSLGNGAQAQVALWLALHGVAALLALAALVQARVLGSGPHAALASTLESFGAGAVLTVLAGLCVWSGVSFLVAGSTGIWAPTVTGAGQRTLGIDRLLLQGGSAALAGAALLVAGQRWPSMRHPLTAAVGLVLATLAWFLPGLGLVLLTLAACAITQRWRLATAAAFAAAWTVGSFYYQLQWPLAHKAALLAGAGALLAALAWLAQRRGRQATAASSAGQPRWPMALLAGSSVLTVLVATYAIREKEQLIASGAPVFIELAPVDPRSLMQGDFMRLNYSLPGVKDDALKQLTTTPRPLVIAKRDERGVATLLRVVPAGSPVAPDEMRIELTPQGGRWMIVSDAWFFAEGDGKRWEAAKYGEFRVAPDGRALLVGLADAQLKPISPKP